MRHRLASIMAAILMAGAGVLAATAAGSVLAASASVTITSGGCSGGGTSYCFTPEQLNVNNGDTATWSNQSGANHTVTSCTAAACPGASANTGSQTFDVAVNAGSSGSVTFTQTGTYVYYCKIHGYAAMHGTVTVAGAAATPTPTATATPAATPTAGSGTPSGTGSSPGTPGTGADLLPATVLALVLISFGAAAVALGSRRHGSGLRR